MRSICIWLGLALLLSPSGGTSPERGRSLEEALARFCAAEPEDRGRYAAEIVSSGVRFQEVFERLEGGCRVPARVKRGRERLTVENADGVRHPYLLLVPEDYDSGRRYPVRFFLHGGVSRPAFGPGDSWWRDPERAAGDWFSVFPASWKHSMWWHASQVESLGRILDRLKTTYNVDENRVYMVGISDGGSGVYYHAIRAATPWAAFLPFIGSAAVVASPRHSDGDFHLPNLANRPFFIVNGEDDRLYPVRTVEPFVRQLEATGADVVFRPLPDVGHEMGWWSSEAERIETFIEARVRDPLPRRLEWQTEWPDRFNRHHWLVITELGEVEGDARFEDSTSGFVRYQRPHGRVRAEQRDNRVVVRSAGVRRLEILLSPRQFDLTLPVRVEVNGRLLHDDRVEPSVATLLEWAARDLDRTMLFAAKLEIDLEDNAP